MYRHRSITAVTLALVIGVSLASGAVASDAVDRQAWAQTGPVLTFAPADDELYVAATAGVEEARSFVVVDLRGMKEHEIRSSSLILEEAESSFRAETGQIVACALEEPIDGEGQLSGPSPAADCSLRTSANRNDEGTWTVDFAVFAPRWSAGELHGVVVFPDPSATASTFRVAFAAMATRVAVPGPAPVQVPPPAPTPDGGSPTAEPSPAITPELDGPSFSDSTLPSPDRPAPVAPPTAGVGERSPDSRVNLPSGERLGGRSTTGSSLAWMALLAATVVLIVAGTPLRRRVVLPSPPERAAMARPMALIGFAGLSLLPLLAREVIVYKAGVVMIFFVAAIGLHVLVNWAGELSLAHAGMVGLPAFAVLALSSVHDISPVYLLPVGLLIGGAVGAIVALPTLRARGVQVALVTLIAGIAIDRYFFTKSWLVGPVSGRAASTPRLGPIVFTTSRSLYIVLVVIAAIAVLAAWILMHSKVARAWYWIRVNADAAAAFGVPVVIYRILAYATGGLSPVLPAA